MGGYSTGPIAKYLDPPGRPGSFIALSRSGRNFLTSDKYLEGAKRKEFKEPATSIAIGDVNYGIYERQPKAPMDAANFYDKEEIVLPGALVVGPSWRSVPVPDLPNQYMMDPRSRRVLNKQQKAVQEARKHNRAREFEVTRREYIMRNRYPYGVVGIDAPVPGTTVYAEKEKEIRIQRMGFLKHAAGRRANLDTKQRSTTYDFMAHGYTSNDLNPKQQVAYDRAHGNMAATIQPRYSSDHLP